MNRVMILFFGVLFLMVASACVESSSDDSSSGDSEDGKTTSDGETFEWKMISTWNEGNPLLENDKAFVKAVEDLSNGAIKIKLHPVDELAAAGEVLETVSDGTVEMGADWPGYWAGKNAAFDLLATQAVGMTQWDYMIWINQAGGQELYDEIYGQFNTVYFPHTVSGMESGIRSNEPINSLEDFKGMKTRISGAIQSNLAEELGAIPTTVAGHEIYESLQRGVIDAAEFSTPYTDESLNLHEVADYWLTPGWHQTASVFGTIINQDAWDSLPDDYKLIIDQASKVTQTMNTTSYAYNDALSAEKMIEEHGVEVTSLSDEDIKKIRGLTNDVVADIAGDNPDFKKVLDSQMEFLEMYSNYRDLQGDWGFGTNMMLDK